MANRIKKVGGYAFYILISNIIYGALLYFMVTWLLNYSELYAYLANLAFIVIALSFDRLINTKIYTPQILVGEIAKLKKDKDRRLNDRMIRWVLNHFVSFKTSLFFFYMFVLLFSQIIKFTPELVGSELGGFINSIDYSVIIVLAYKDFSEEFFKDRSKMKITLEEYEKLVEIKEKSLLSEEQKISK